MKSSIKLFALLLTLILSSTSLFASCSNSNTETPAVTTEVSNTDVPNENKAPDLESPIVICDKNGVYYKLIRPDETTNEVINCLNMILNYPEDKGIADLYLSFGSDWVIPGTETSGFFEILIGNTCRPETKEIMADLSYGDYAVVSKGNKIVVAAHTEETLKAAVEVLYNDLLKIETDESGNQRIVFTKNYYFRTDKASLFNDENPLSNYKIVCDKGSLVAAQNLQKAIKKTYNIELSVVDESESETELEIVVGDVMRDICKEIDKSKINAIEYLFISKDKKLLIAAHQDKRTIEAIDSFCESYVNTYYSDELNFYADDKSAGISYTFKDTTELALGSDIRVMSFNVLCELWDDMAKNYEERAKTAAAVIRKYSPDVVGLQEMSDAYHSKFNLLFGSDYQFVDSKNENGNTNFSPLAYNTKNVTLKDHGTKIFAEGNSVKMRLMSWALFTDKDSGKDFVVINTHWDLTGNSEYRTSQSNEMANFVNTLKTRFNCPVITTGDYNTKENENQYKTYVNKAGLAEAKHTAKKAERKNTTYHTLGTSVSTADANSIDHIFGTSDVEFLYYNTLIDKIIIDASDHCPIYADIKLK